MARTRRTFDEEFKRNALRMLAEGRTEKSVADELQITTQQLRTWRAQTTEPLKDGARTAKEYEAELRALRQRAERAEKERDILKKKAVSIFSHPSSQK
ncbi:MAG: transposase [Ignavibacteria bacterium]|nr:transposase [Ignavibacteria bacterium]